MNNTEAYASLRAENLTHEQAETELAAARKGHGQFLGWSLLTGYRVKFV